MKSSSWFKQGFFRSPFSAKLPGLVGEARKSKISIMVECKRDDNCILHKWALWKGAARKASIKAASTLFSYSGTHAHTPTRFAGFLSPALARPSHLLVLPILLLLLLLPTLLLTHSYPLSAVPSPGMCSCRKVTISVHSWRFGEFR